MRRPIRVVAVAAGSWGDVLPFVGPARALLDRGHDVVVAAPPIFARPLRRLGLKTATAGSFLKRETIRGFDAAVEVDDDGSTAFETYWRTMIAAEAPAIARDLRPIIQGADVVLAHYHSLGAYAALLRAPESVRYASYAWGPAYVVSEGYLPPRAGMQASISGSRSTRALWDEEIAWTARATDAPTAAALDASGVRDDSGLAVAPFSLPVRCDVALLASHRGLVPDQPDWPGHVVQVGYPYFDAVPGTREPRDLTEFMSRSPRRPVALVAFGTAVANGLGPRYRLFVNALAELDCRVVVLGGDESIAPSDNVFVSRFVPLSSVISRVALVVHHGGAGITHAALRAGVPAVVVPRFLDQPFHARMVEAAKAGAAIIGPIDAERARTACESALSSTTVRQAAASIAESLAAEPSPAEAIADRICQLAALPKRGMH